MLPKDFIKRGARVWIVIPHEDGTWGTIKSVGRKYIVVDNKKFHIDTHLDAPRPKETGILRSLSLR